MALGKGARVNHITGRPRALSSYHSLTVFNASKNTPFYSPFQFLSNVAGKQLGKNANFRAAVYGSKSAVPEEQVLQRGMVSMITAGRKADLLERKAVFAADGTAQNRAAKKVLKAQGNVGRLAQMNNPLSVVRGPTTNPVLSAARVNARFAGEFMMPAHERLALARAAGLEGASTSVSYKGLGASGVNNAVAGGQKVGLTGNLMASAGASQGSRFVQGYFRGALGFANAGGLTDDALRGAQRAVSHLGVGLGQTAGVASTLDDAGRVAGRFAGTFEGKAAQALEQGVFKTLGVKRTMQVAATKHGAMALGARTAAMAIPGLNLLATASLVYDLGKMGGELVKSGINLAKDAVKSMKGSIDKPMFGMGYKDNEVAATSRSRGVMAIQNSRLNARSMLGSEGSMMAAHFG